nr:right-handed parallel beta-helix repeat-containing protein [Bacteroidota bacterium]
MIEQADADLFVSTSGDNSNSGLSVAEPLQNIRFAFSKMLAGETNPHTIHIADGIYSHSATGEVYPLNIPEYISLYGESELGTVLDGEWLTAVMRIISNSTSQIENLTVTNGVGGSESTGGGTAPYYWAGGVTLHDHSDLLIKNVSVVGNSSGIYCTSASSPTIENVTIDGNEGTGLYCKWSCNADISFSTITNNLGSGIACSNSDPNIQDVTITGNTGSGVWCFDVSSPLLKNVLISNNEGGMDCSNGCFPYLENVTICYNTTVNGNGGGIYCRYSASPVFDTVNRCNIYMNQAAFAQDYYAEVEQNVVVDTFTVINPSSYQAFPRHLFNFDILNSKTELVDADLYVSPDGDNSNSGISVDEALKNIDYAFSMIMADSSHQNTIHLLDGIYSPSTNEESFPVYMLDYVNLMGASKEGVILDAEGQSTVLSIKNNISNHISNLTISGGDGNHSNPDNQAGGISIWNSSIWLNDISVQDNTSGGISILWVSCPLLENISVVNNGDVWRGGGIFISGNGCNPVLKNVLIAENQAEHVGGGIYISSHADPTFINVTLSNNSATQGNGGIYSESFNDPEIFNSIIWDNDPPELFGSFTITCSDIQGGWQGEGNIDEDPLFIGSGAHPYALLDESPCINTGTTDTTGLNLPELDLAGNPRIYGGRIDMGAYENQSVSTLIQNPQSSNLNLICSPNPFTEELTITWNQTESAHTTIEIYNSAGKRIETRVSEIFSEGDHQLNWNTNSIPPGIYFLRMQTENETVKQKIIKL